MSEDYAVVSFYHWYELNSGCCGALNRRIVYIYRFWYTGTDLYAYVMGSCGGQAVFLLITLHFACVCLLACRDYLFFWLYG